MKSKLFILIGFICAYVFIFFIGCQNGASSSDKVSEPKKVVKQTPETLKPETAVKKTPEPANGKPSIFIPEDSFEFPPTVDGIKITHDYIIKNKGDSDLEITRVKTS